MNDVVFKFEKETLKRVTVRYFPYLVVAIYVGL